MVKKYLIMLLAICTMIGGCGKIIDDTENATVSTPVEQPKQEQKEPEIQREGFKVTIAGEEKRISLIESEDYSLYLKSTVDSVNGTVAYCYEVEQKAGRDIQELKIENLSINDKEVSAVDLVELENADDSDMLWAEATKVMSFLQINDIELNKISGGARAIYSDDAETTGINEFSAEISNNGKHDIELYPFKDALCLEQTLQSDDKVQITLKGLGRFENDSDQKVLKGILEISNKSDEAIPFSVQELIINGCCFSISGAALIGPGKIYYSDFSLKGEEVDKMGITSISSMSIYLLSDFNENSSISGEIMMGGKTYELNLDQKGNGNTWRLVSEPIYDENDIKVYVAGCKEDDGKGAFVSFAPSVTYNLIVQNDTDKDISFNYSDTKYEGKDCAKGGDIIKQMDESYTNWSVLTNVIPAGSCKSVDIAFRNWDMVFPCEVSCKFDFTGAGGGQILYRSDDIFLTSEMEEMTSE